MMLKPHTIELFGCRVSIPISSTLPLKSVHDSLSADLSVTLGVLSNPEYKFTLDDACEISIRGNQVAVNPTIDMGPLALEHYVIDHAIPNGLATLGHLMVHAAGIYKAGHGIILAGPSGSGKSTSSAYLMQQGWQSLGDDALRVTSQQGQHLMHPGYPGIRLFPDVVESGLIDSHDKFSHVAEYSNKTRLDPDKILFRDKTAPLNLILFLSAGECFRAEALSKVANVEKLARQLFLPPAPSHEALERLTLTSELGTHVAGYNVEIPRNKEGLASLTTWLEEKAIPSRIT